MCLRAGRSGCSGSRLRRSARVGRIGSAWTSRYPSRVSAVAPREEIGSRRSDYSRSRQADGRGAAHGSSGGVRFYALLRRECLYLPAGTAGPARQSGHEDQDRTHSARAAWSDRDCLALELSLLHSCHGIAVRAGNRKCGGAEAIRTHVAGRCGTGFIAASSRCAEGCISGHRWRWNDRLGAVEC
jgi:hypothetical protein